MIDIGVSISIATTAAAALAWYRSYTRNAYARERQYETILEGLEQNHLAHDALLKELDLVGDRLSRLEILLLDRRFAERN